MNEICILLLICRKLAGQPRRGLDLNNQRRRHCAALFIDYSGDFMRSTVQTKYVYIYICVYRICI